jgi:hypothetical protein
LNCAMQLQFDPQPLHQLFAKNDVHVAEEVVCRMLEDIALRLDMLQRELTATAFAQMDKPARRVSLVARELGLTEVMNSAQHVRVCLSQGDAMALQATMARLERGFDVAVSEIWNFRNL